MAAEQVSDSPHAVDGGGATKTLPLATRNPAGAHHRAAGGAQGRRELLACMKALRVLAGQAPILQARYVDDGQLRGCHGGAGTAEASTEVTAGVYLQLILI